VTVEPHALPDQGVELAGQEVGQVEGGDLARLGAFGKRLVAVEEAVVVRPFDALEPR